MPPDSKVSIPLGPSSKREDVSARLPAGVATTGRPALTAGGRLLRMVTVTLSSAVSVPSETVRVKVMVVSDVTCGTVNVVVRAAASENVIGRDESCVHWYVRASSSGSEAVPDSVTVSPLPAVWAEPASTAGGLLAAAVPE